MAAPPPDLHEWVTFDAPDEPRTFAFDVTFLTSPWHCIYGGGCQGVLTAAAAVGSRISGFREDTRAARMRIADEAQHRFGRKVSWGARCGDAEVRFTTLSVPAMTRLRMPERRVLDTLVEAGVARSRSHALAWCVRLVAERQEDWLSDLRAALERVGEVRAEGPRD